MKDGESGRELHTVRPYNAERKQVMSAGAPVSLKTLLALSDAPEHEADADAEVEVDDTELAD
jgi:hypothetical protein